VVEDLAPEAAIAGAEATAAADAPPVETEASQEGRNCLSEIFVSQQRRTIFEIIFFPLEDWRIFMFQMERVLALSPSIV